MSTITMAAGSGTGAGTMSWGRAPGNSARQAPRGVPVEAVSAARARLRLTRRARLLMTLVAMVSLAFVLAVLVTGGSSAAAGTSAPATHQRVTVSAGQTLWQIAQRAKPGTDPRETIDAMLRLNNLKTAEVQVGTALLLP